MRLVSRCSPSAALLAAVALLVLCIPGEASAEPRFVRLSYSHQDTATRITLGWNTAEERPTVVQYGLDGDYGLQQDDEVQLFLPIGGG